MGWKNYLVKNNQKILLLFLILISTAFRFWDLGYSDYIPDEYKSFMILKEGETVSDFFLNQRKGPMQFLVNLGTFYFSENYKNELLHRIPFTIISVLNVYLFFLIAKKFTQSIENSYFISLFSAFIFSFNGFIFGFSRITQYQNLNMFFSFISLLIFFKLLESKTNKKILINSFLSSLFFIFSILSHWDAVFYLIPMAIILIQKYFLDKDTKFLLKSILVFIFTNLVILGSLFYLYVSNLKSNSSNLEYLERRIEFLSSDFKIYYEYITLYNPYLFFVLAISSLIFSLYFFKKNLVLNLWFIIVFLLFILFFKKPGTHIYNFLIPVFIMIGIFLNNIWETSLFKKIPENLRRFKYLFISLIISFLIYQTYILFVDSKNEYPFEEDRILFLKTKEYKYSEEDKLPLFGFPHRRGWNYINNFLIEENNNRGLDLKYISNEDDGIAKYYMDLKYGQGEKFYYIGVRNPQNFIKDPNPRNFKIVEKILEDNKLKIKIWIVTKKVKKDKYEQKN